MLILHPRVVADPIDSSIIIDAGIAIDGALIAGCGPYRQIRERFGPADEIDLSDCIVLPGLVNAHTHLELSHLRGKIPYDGDFVDWVFRLTKARGDSHDSLEKILIDACRESLQGGVTTVGDICYEHRAWRHLKQLPPQGNQALKNKGNGGRIRKFIAGSIFSSASPILKPMVCCDWGCRLMHRIRPGPGFMR